VRWCLKNRASWVIKHPLPFIMLPFDKESVIS
jgi:hypothetical protein